MKQFEGDDIDSDKSEQFDDEELLAINRHFKGKKINRNSNRNSKMNPQTEAIYREGLKDMFFGRFQESSKKLKFCMTHNPNNPLPYLDLGRMHAEAGQHDKAVEYNFIGAYLSTSNFQTWKSVGQASFDHQMYTQAAYCFGRALKIENYNIQIMTRRAEAFEMANMAKQAISTYKKILNITFSLPVLKKYAKLRFKRGQYETAREILMTYSDHQKDIQTFYLICETYLNQQKFEDLLEYFDGFIKIEIQKNADFCISSLNLQLIIILFISLIKVKRETYPFLNTSVEQIKQLLIQNYEEEYSKQFQNLISYIKTEDKICEQILQKLMLFKPHKKIQNYLIYTEFLKKNSKFDKAIQVLKEGLNIHKNSAQLTSQLNYIKVITGKWKQTHRTQVRDFKNKSLKNETQKVEDIYYSDQDEENVSNQNQILSKKDKNQVINIKNKDNKVVSKKNVQTQDPQIIKRLLRNCRQTLESIIQQNLEQKNNLSRSYKQVQDVITYIINLTSRASDDEQKQKQGLFNRVHRRRRYITSKQTNRKNVLNMNLSLIVQILNNIVQFTKNLLEVQQFNKIKSITQMLSKAYFFGWQNKSFQLKSIKKTLYQIGLLACLNLQKYEAAVFFIRYLAHRDPNNSFYLLIVNYLLHNSSTKICMNSLLGKYLNRTGFNSTNRGISNDSQMFDKQNQSEMFQQDQNNSDGLSYPRKLSNMSNLSDILRDNVKLNYLFGIQYMETGYFDLAISSFLKIINLCQGQIKKTIWLTLSSCFLQIGSSRTCHSKLPQTNRSTYCMRQYLNASNDQLQKSFNIARFYAQLRMNDKAIRQFNKILDKKLQSPQQKQIQSKSAHCLMCIYKQMQDWDKVNEISEKYFNLQDEKMDLEQQRKDQQEYF